LLGVRRLRTSDDRGSTIPLILGFFLVALLVVAGAVALGDAFVDQRNLQDVCDGAAAAAAASAVDLDRTDGVGAGDSLRFAHVEAAVDAYLTRDAARRDVAVTAALTDGGTRITLVCAQTMPLAFGAVFGRPTVRHVATASARAAVVR
jgi:Putative Flp pilus-assembly TadE/G-like